MARGFTRSQKYWRVETVIDINAPLYLLVFIGTLLITVISERILIPRLQRSAEQPIYEGGPKWHMSKRGTPTMGGLAFLIAVTVCCAVATVYLAYTDMIPEALSLIGCAAYALLNALVGVLDDYTKLKSGKNAGLSPKEKLVLQSMLAIAFLIYRYLTLGEGGKISFSAATLEIGWVYYPLTFLVLVGITNCANLTDGIDGLASGVAFAIGVSAFFISCALSTDAAIISSALTGATVGFLFFNIHPARIFMGDTGSLFLGATVGALGVALGNPVIILILGGVYCLEGASVIIQVIWYKLTHKRIFKMAPLHHHLERSGWSENRICIAAMILTLLLAIPAYLIYLP